MKNISSPDGPVSAAMGHPPRVLIAAGGTGGHVYPAIAIADALRSVNPEVELLFVGTRNHMEWEEVPRAGYDIVNVWISGFHRRLTPKNLLFPLKLGTSLVQSWNIVSRFRPEAAVSCGRLCCWAGLLGSRQTRRAAGRPGTEFLPRGYQPPAGAPCRGDLYRI
ncbi:MAG: glycosyltransferase [Balneolaceae bacterium]|nr:glycosyltransferase [Balneolaceae bacterium]